jgi:hypothetical protein
MADTPPDASDPAIINAPSAPIVPEKKRQGVSWFVWAVDVALFLVAVIGALYTWPTQAEATRLTKRRTDLERRAGHLPISDENKYHVLRLPSEKPGEFRWRVYAPPRSSHTLQMKSSSEGSSSASSSGSSGGNESSEGLIRAVFTFDENGTVQLLVKFRMTGNQSSHQTQIFDKQIAEMVRNSDFSQWKIVGSNGIETFTIDDLITLLHVETPSARENGPGGLLDVSFGTQQAVSGKDSGT